MEFSSPWSLITCEWDIWVISCHSPLFRAWRRVQGHLKACNINVWWDLPCEKTFFCLFMYNSSVDVQVIFVENHNWAFDGWQSDANRRQTSDISISASSLRTRWYSEHAFIGNRAISRYLSPYRFLADESRNRSKSDHLPILLWHQESRAGPCWLVNCWPLACPCRINAKWRMWRGRNERRPIRCCLPGWGVKWFYSSDS